jgi:Glycosyl transferase family 2
VVSNEDEKRLSIGLLAHNEAPRIEATLVSLFKQDVFRYFPTELAIIANGCTDETAEVSRRLLSQHREVWSTRGTATVEEILTPGKANAWNEFVHRVSSRHVSTLVIMDADISIIEPNSISSMIKTLHNDRSAVACQGRAIKDIVTFFGRLVASATSPIDPNNLGLCGQLYCVVASQARQIKLPAEITVEDGFLRALLLTCGFTRPEDTKRIIADPNAVHSYVSVATLRELFKHERWIVAGNIVNAMLFERFWSEARPGLSAMQLMECWLTLDPQWLEHYIRSQVKERGWRLLPKDIWTRRLSRLRGLPIEAKLRKLPIAAVASIVDAVIFTAAICDVRRGRAFRYWGRT